MGSSVLRGSRLGYGIFGCLLNLLLVISGRQGTSHCRRLKERGEGVEQIGIGDKHIAQAANITYTNSRILNEHY